MAGEAYHRASRSPGPGPSAGWLKAGSLRYDTLFVGIGAGRRAVACALALGLGLTLPAARGSAAVPGAGADEARARAAAVRAELTGLLQDLTAAGRAADRASERWMSLRLRELELRAAEEEARNAFQARVREAYMAGPGRAVDFLLSSSDLHDFAARLPYASTSLALGQIDLSELSARRQELDAVLRDAENAQQALGGAETQLAGLRATIEQRLADAETSARSDAGALAIVEQQRKRYVGTIQQMVGATRAIRRRRGEQMFAAAAPFLGPRADCSVPRGLRSTGDQISGGASWYGDAFRGKPTASGAIFWPLRFTVAHRTLAFGLFLLIRYRDRCVVSFLNDRGPYVDGRILDLSYGSALAVGLSGVKDVTATLLVRAR